MKITDNGDVEVTLASDVTFASGSDQLSEAAKKALRRVAPKLANEFSSYLIRIEGHTDSSGLASDNDTLSQARAEAVRDYLVAHGIATERLEPKGFGSSQPLAPNATPEGRLKNRRVVFSIVK